jgi:hypothetical protein
VLDRAGLARKAAALDEWRRHRTATFATSNLERLVDDETQRRTREIDFLIAAIDRDLAAAGLDPDAGDRVLAAAGCIGAALCIDFLFAQRARQDGELRRSDGFDRRARSGP